MDRVSFISARSRRLRSLVPSSYPNSCSVVPTNDSNIARFSGVKPFSQRPKGLNPPEESLNDVFGSLTDPYF